MSEIVSPHDRFFKGLFGKPEIARSFVQNYLPAEILNLLDLETPALTGESFVDVELQAQISELVYQLRWRDGRRAYLYLLFEHKSYVAPYVPFQVLRYMVRLWERQIITFSGLFCPIIPVVFYHGRSP